MFISGLSDQRKELEQAVEVSTAGSQKHCHMKGSLKKVPTPLTQDVCSKNKHSQWEDGEDRV